MEALRLTCEHARILLRIKKPRRSATKVAWSNTEFLVQESSFLRETPRTPWLKSFFLDSP